ncbi:SET domain-containing protein SmydA-8-like isoform X2 [Portunus trituberculatus]|nr:SET domain-containing protein SmydA-8-like isoform X2 [Portunus trituberculatus]
MGGAEGHTRSRQMAPQPQAHRQKIPSQALQAPDFPVAEQSSSDAGRFLVAQRPVSPGELLVYESPVALGPRASCYPVCLGCHELISDEAVPRCERCWWPLCSQRCASSLRHAAECPVLAADSQRIGQPQFFGYSSKYDVILVVRCLLLRRTNPDAWRHLLELASHVPYRLLEDDDDHQTTVDYVTQVLKVEEDTQLVHHVRDAITTNSFEWTSPSGVRLRGLYLQLSRLNHSCRPSVSVSSDGKGTMFVRAARDLAGGDALTVAYTSTLHPLWERRAYTKQTHYFICDCDRCSDPTELGVHYSSLPCPECRGQYLEPTTWLGDATWECPVCGRRQEEAAIREEVDRWMSRFDYDDTFIKSTPTAVRGILDGVQMAFHAHHYVWVMAAQVAIRTLAPDHSRKAMTLKRQLWQRLLHIYSILEPGMTRRRGVTLYHLGTVEADLTRVERGEGTLTDHFFRQELHRALQHLQEAADIMNLEPSGSHELNWLQKIQVAINVVAGELGEAPPVYISFPSQEKNGEVAPMEKNGHA